MGTITADEVNFQQLLDRTERLLAEDISFNIFKLHAALKELEEIYNRLQQNRNIDRDVLKYYGENLSSLRIQIEAEQKNSHTVSNEQELPADFEVDTGDSAEEESFIIKAKIKAAEQANLRMQLLGESERPATIDLDLNPEQIARREAEKQENLMDELYDMARLMKQTYSTAGTVIKEDNATLSRLQFAANSHKGSLLRENKRLEERAYRSWCDCLYIVGVCAIVMSFLSMFPIKKLNTMPVGVLRFAPFGYQFSKV
uniref:Vesicle transport protein USE1 n=1 Tax=Setaria digitata TaxID=48799 RepID=A0A915Q6E9_9BILA